MLLRGPSLTAALAFSAMNIPHSAFYFLSVSPRSSSMLLPPQYSRENSRLASFIIVVWYRFQNNFAETQKFSLQHNMKDLQVRWYQTVVTYGQKYILERWDSLLLHSFRFCFAFWISFAVSKLYSVCEYLGLRLLMQLPSCWPFPLYSRVTSHRCLLQLFDLFNISAAALETRGRWRGLPHLYFSCLFSLCQSSHHKREIEKVAIVQISSLCCLVNLIIFFLLHQLMSHFYFFSLT